MYGLCSGSERGAQRAVFLDGMLRGTKAVMTRVKLGGTLFLVAAVIGVLLTSPRRERRIVFFRWLMRTDAPLCTRRLHTGLRPFLMPYSAEYLE